MEAEAAALLMREVLLEQARRSPHRTPSRGSIKAVEVARVAIRMVDNGVDLTRFEDEPWALDHLGKITLDSILRDREGLA